MILPTRWIAGMCLACLVGCGAPSGDRQAEPAQAGKSIYDFTVRDIEQRPVALEQYRGKVLLVVNVASKCGFTKQYAGLQDLQETYGDRGLVVMGFPCNQFGNQEPGSQEQIARFCTRRFGVTFPMFAKIDVKGDNQAPLYAWLTSEGQRIGWNFNKFLIGPDGRVVGHYESKVKPTSPALTSAIEQQLARRDG